ncbi:MAG: hypothetical protein CL569_08295 [Alphaproteobacteria bacterium]|nr:hypothetical protein [Alphaproteobacteria bacterium]|tara:strand:+ start:950 stop:1213 length:264 start_codon:yes stop_codon:yes gene_type:complete
MTDVGWDSTSRFLTGRGQYVDDLRFDDEAFAFVLRSPHAHARIHDMDLTDARACEGVLLVLSGAAIEGVLGEMACKIPTTLRREDVE